MSIVLNDNIKVSAPKPSDPRYLNSSNVAYTNVSQANSTIPVTERHEGLQVKVDTDIYWYKNGTADSDLVLFSAGSTGSTITASNGLVKVGNDIRLGGALTGSTTLSGGAFNYNASGNRHVILNLNTETGGPDNNGGIQLKVLDGSNGTTLSMDDFGFVLSNNVSGFPGAKYGADYSTHYTDRSLVDKGFVLGLVSGSSLTANNGLTKSGNNIYLGGLLTGDTIISGITNNTITIATSTGDTNTTLTITPLDLTVNGYVNGNLDTFFDVGQGQIQCQAGQGGMYIQSQGAAVFYSSSGASINMDVGDIFITADQYNTSASLDFKTSGITFSFLAPVVGGLSISDSVSPAGRANASGRASFAMGSAAFAKGLHSFAGGQGTTSGNKQILATGSTSFNFSTNDSSQTSGHGALASSSAILGGTNHNIPKTSTNSVVIGGNGIKVSTGVTNTVHLPKVRIGLGSGSIVQSNTNPVLVVRNNTTGELETRVIFKGTSSFTGSSTTTFTIPLGTTLGSNVYTPLVTPKNSGAAAPFYVNNLTTTTFDVVYLTSITGVVQHYWHIIP